MDRKERPKKKRYTKPLLCCRDILLLGFGPTLCVFVIVILVWGGEIGEIFCIFCLYFSSNLLLFGCVVWHLVVRWLRLWLWMSLCLNPAESVFVSVSITETVSHWMWVFWVILIFYMYLRYIIIFIAVFFSCNIHYIHNNW